MQLFIELIFRTVILVSQLVFWGVCQCARALLLVGNFGLSFIKGPSKSHGSARWAKKAEIRKAGLLQGHGPIIGKIGGDFLRYNDKEGTMIVFAPTRAGKGTGIVVPTILDYPGSLVVLDPKGENYAVTHKYRQSLGPVYRINLESPYESHAFNPLHMVRVHTPHEIADAEKLADLMLFPEPGQPQHWRERALAWLSGYILHVIHTNQDTPDLMTLTEVRNMMFQHPEEQKTTLEEMQQSPCASVRETAVDMLQMGDTNDEAKSFFSNMKKGTGIYTEGRPSAWVTGSSDFDLYHLNEKPTTIYLTVPEDDLKVYGPLLRIFIGCTLMGLQRSGRHKKPPEHPTLLLLDECATLGYMEPLETGMGYLSAYARAMLIFQDIHQLQEAYPKSGTILSNAKCHVLFGVNCLQTAEIAAKRIGQKTIATKNRGMSRGTDDILAQHYQAGESETGRFLLDPAEIMRLSQDKILAFFRKELEWPVLADGCRYFREPYFKGKWQNWRDDDGEGFDIRWLEKQKAPKVVDDLAPGSGPAEPDLADEPIWFAGDSANDSLPRGRRPVPDKISRKR